MKDQNTNIFSEYIGRSLGAFILMLVLVITASAIIMGGGLTGRDSLKICTLEPAPAPRTSALHTVLATVEKRKIIVSPPGRIDIQDCDLLVVPAFSWLTDPDMFDGEPVGSIAAFPDRSGDALIVVPGDGRLQTLAHLSVEEIHFSSPRSLNCCWNQLQALHERGLPLPSRLDKLHFGSGAGEECDHTLIALLSGTAAAGACRSGTVEDLKRAGILAPDAVAIVARQPALPEMLIISKHDNTAYCRQLLERARNALSAGGSPAANEARPIILGTLTPETLRRMNAIGLLIAKYRGQF